MFAYVWCAPINFCVCGGLGLGGCWEGELVGSGEC